MSDYEYGEEIEANCGNQWEKRTFVFQLPNGSVCTLHEGVPIQDFENDMSSHRIFPKHRKITKPKPPEYVAYTMETFKPHRDKWFRYKGSNYDLSRINSYDDNCVWVGSASQGHNYDEFLKDYKHEDGSPCGTIKEEVK
ncbi:hypothetical protein COB55_03075 [Candidatus Wolfebacteria bacterium]|nr:MAG: hypothetical protein COB55_03075 [Candidatus Wolfebacteria bacterium]